MQQAFHTEKTSAVRARPLSIPAAYLEPPAREELPHIDKDAAAVVLDKFLVRVAHHESACRLKIGRLAARLLDSRAYQRLGFARVGDYTLERLGLSAREIQSAARVSRAIDALPSLGEALRSGELNWTKLRMVCDVADADSVDDWIALAQRMTSRELETHVKEQRRMLREAARSHGQASHGTASHGTAASVDGGSISDDRNVDDEDTDLVDGEPRAQLHIRCPGHLRPLWHDVSELASRSAGSALAGWQALELVAAEAASGGDLSNSNVAARGDGNDARRAFGAFIRKPGHDCAGRDCESERRPRITGWDGELEVLRALVGSGLNPAPGEAGDLDPFDAHPFDSDPLDSDPMNADPMDPGSLDADQLDDALREVLKSMRNIDWQLGRLLATFTRLNLHQHIGYSSLAVYARERLGLSSRKASSLIRIEGNPAEGRRELAAAYRAGRISWIRTIALLPVMSQRHGEAWINRAEQVTVRRLFDEVRWALDMRDRSWLFMELVPPSLGARLEHSDAAADRQMRALYDADTVARIKQRPCLDNTYLRFSGPVSVIELFHDVLQSYADRSTPWEPAWMALERLLLHVKAQWSGVPGHRNPIHERDGWRCRVPGCSSRRNLQEHHVLFRSRGGGNERGNRISICAWHHLRGIHTGRVRAHGDAETGIHWQLGNRLTLVDDVYA